MSLSTKCLFHSLHARRSHKIGQHILALTLFFAMLFELRLLTIFLSNRPKLHTPKVARPFSADFTWFLWMIKSQLFYLSTLKASINSTQCLFKINVICFSDSKNFKFFYIICFCIHCDIFLIVPFLLIVGKAFHVLKSSRLVTKSENYLLIKLASKKKSRLLS